MNQRLAYSIREAAELLGVSRSFAYQLIAAGTLNTYKMGRRRLCSHSALVDCQKAMEKAADGRKAA